MKTFSATRTCLALIFSLSWGVAQATDYTGITIDPIAAAYIADQCEIPISPARTNWIESVKRSNSRGDIAHSEEQGAAILRINIERMGRHKACYQFRNTLAHLWWL